MVGGYGQDGLALRQDGRMRRGGPAGAWDDQLGLALPPGEDAPVRRAGALVLRAEAGEAVSPAGVAPLCAVHGRLHELARLAGELGLPPEAGAPEVLAAGWRRWEHGLVERLRGAFVVLVYDPEHDRGLLARDQLGAATLLVDERGGGLRFATELRDLLALGPVRPAPDPHAVVRFLATSQVPVGRSLYEGVRRVPPGTLVRLEAGRTREATYWRPVYRPPARRTLAEAAGELRAEVTAAVSRTVDGRAGAGVLLSGGLDSTTVAACLRAGRRSDGGLHAYSLTLPDDPEADESALVDGTVDALALRLTRARLRRPALLRAALEFQRTWSAPSVSPNLYLTVPLLRRAAADGVPVVLDGEGGDELFGLAPYLPADRLRAGRFVSALALARRRPPDDGLRGLRATWGVLRRYALAGALAPGPHRRLAARRAGPPSPILRPRAHTLLEETVDPLAWKRGDAPRWWADLARTLTAGREELGTGELFERRAVLAGVAQAHPLLTDVGLVERVLALPPQLAYDARWDRALLRAAMAGLVPDAVRLRPEKSFFTAPAVQALAGPDRPGVERLLARPDAEVYAYLDRETVQRGLLDVDLRAAPRRWGWLWRTLVCEAWLQGEADPGFADRALRTWGLPGAQVELGDGA